jgi:hypothetical protein
MTLKSSALFALIGTLVLTILLVVGLIFDLLSLAQGLISVTAVLSSLIHSFAALTVTLFFYTFHKAQA